MDSLSLEEKEKIAAMSRPADMPYDERKRQYAALRRDIVKSASPELLAKFSFATDRERDLAFSCASRSHLRFRDVESLDAKP